MNKYYILRLYIIIPLIPFFIGCTPTIKKIYPQEVEDVLIKAGSNRKELEKVIAHFQEEKDSLKIQATYFLIKNMDIHYSETYYWKNNSGKKVDFNEFDYPSYAAAVNAADSIRQINGLNFQETTIYDINSITSKFLINNINSAFDAWQNNPLFRKIEFKDFCEYILPYRVTIEPLHDWRNTYQKKFEWMTDSLKINSIRRVLIYAGMEYKTWFSFSFDQQNKAEPLSRLSAMQLLFRKRGACEDVATLETFILRSQGIPVSYLMMPVWPTSSGTHFMNDAFDEKMNPIRFDVTVNDIVDRQLEREPSKILRVTYSKQPETIAMQEKQENIPPSFLRKTNYIDVTTNWWETSDVAINLFSEISQEKIAYAYAFSGGRWQPIWWGKVNEYYVTFKDMPNGIVILPAYYKNGHFTPAGYPFINGYNNKLHLVTDTINQRKVVIKQQEYYLIFRPGKKYELFYWDNKWISVGEKIAEAKSESEKLVFENVPSNSLLLLLPEYTEGKERPFIITDEGERFWF